MQRLSGVERLELDGLLEPVSRHVALHPFDHPGDGCLDGRVIAVALDEAIHGVAHENRRIGGVEDDHRFASLRSANDFSAVAVVSVNSSMLARVPGPADLDEIDDTISA